VGFTALTGTATTGTPADPGESSANPGQVLTLTGSGFTAQTDIVAKFLDDNGTLVVQGLLPNSGSVSGDGTQALLTVPPHFNGAFALHMVGSAFAPLLQIVPVLSGIDINGHNSARLTGQGLVDANGTVYQFANGSVVDNDLTSTNVFSSGTLVDLTLPVAGDGTLTVTTAGGTSAALPWNVISPVLGTTVVDVAYNAASSELLVASTISGGNIFRINPATGAQLGSFAIPVQNSSSLGMDILPVAATLRNTATGTDIPLPAGSLIVFNGAPNTDRIIALDPVTGAVLATLNMANNFDIVGGAVTADGRFLVLDNPTNTVREIDPLTGAEVPAAAFAAGMDINFGDIAVHPATGNVWIASSQTPTLREYTAAGVFVRSIDVTPQGVGSELSGLAFRPDGGDFDLFGSSTLGVVYVLPDPLVSLSLDGSGSAGDVVSVPVNISDGEGLQSLSLTIQYDPAVLEVSPENIKPGSLTAGAEIETTVDDDAGTILVTLTTPAPLAAGAGSLLEIDFRISPQARPGITLLDLQQVRLNEGGLILTTDPVRGDDPTDGRIRVLPRSEPDRLVALFDLPGKRLNTRMDTRLDFDSGDLVSKDHRPGLAGMLRRRAKIRWD
jgi:hypothetical protein